MNGIFVTFEGGEGSGKSTQIELLYTSLLALAKPVLLTREPGGCPSAESIRTLLVEGRVDKWHPAAETLLFQAARVEHAERVIKPALAEGKIVLCDRFLDSTVVYQGMAKQVGETYVHDLHRLSLGSFAPGLTFLLDIDPILGLERASMRPGMENRFEHMDKQFHIQVRQGFLALAKQEPGRFVVIDASQPPGIVHDAIIDAFKTRFH